MKKVVRTKAEKLDLSPLVNPVNGYTSQSDCLISEIQQITVDLKRAMTQDKKGLKRMFREKPDWSSSDVPHFVRDVLVNRRPIFNALDLDPQMSRWGFRWDFIQDGRQAKIYSAFIMTMKKAFDSLNNRHGGKRKDSGPEPLRNMEIRIANQCYKRCLKAAREIRRMRNPNSGNYLIEKHRLNKYGVTFSDLESFWNAKDGITSGSWAKSIKRKYENNTLRKGKNTPTMN